MSSDHNDEHLERARREIRAQASALGERPLLERAIPAVPLPAESSAAIEYARLSYSIAQVAGEHHRAFVEQAFRALLKRAPAPAEVATQIARLATGTSKTEVLGDLRWSPEGRRIGAQISGLRPRYLLDKARRVPVVGYLLDWCMNLAALPLQARHQRALETYLAARDEVTRQIISSLELQSRTIADAAVASTRHADQRLDDLHAFAHQLALARDELTRGLDAAESELRARIAAEAALRSRIEALEAGAAHSEARATRLAARLDELEFIRERFYAMNHWTHHLGEAFARIEDVAAARAQDLDVRAATIALAAIAADPLRPQRLGAWVEALAHALPARANVLALGGAGDWNTALAAHGFTLTCAEPSGALADASRVPGVVVDCVDAREALRRSADASLDGVCMLAASANVRALPLIDLLGEVRRVLRPGGVLLLADAREAAALVDTLSGRTGAAAIAMLPADVFHASGFTQVRRIDAADGTPAWLLQRAAT